MATNVVQTGFLKVTSMHTPRTLAQSGSEDAEQRAFFAYMNFVAKWGWRKADLWATDQLFPPFGDESESYSFARWIHSIPNGASFGGDKRSRQITGAKMKATGLTAGVLDVFWPMPSMPYRGLYIEFKKKKGGHLSPEQGQFGRFVLAMGYAVSVETTWQGAAHLCRTYALGDNVLKFNDEEFIRG